MAGQATNVGLSSARVQSSDHRVAGNDKLQYSCSTELEILFAMRILGTWQAPCLRLENLDMQDRQCCIGLLEAGSSATEEECSLLVMISTLDSC